MADNERDTAREADDGTERYDIDSMPEFKKQPANKRNKKPRVSIRQSQSIGFSKRCMEQYIGDAEEIKIKFDAEIRAIVFIPLAEATGEFFKLSRTEDGMGVISPTAFMKEYDITPEQTTKYDVKWFGDQGESGAIVIDLREAGIRYGEATTEDEADEDEVKATN